MNNTKSTFRAPFLGIRPHDAPRQSAAPSSTPGLSTPTAPLEKQGYSTEQLFGSASEIEIMHRGETYQLRITRQEKLILTK